MDNLKEMAVFVQDEVRMPQTIMDYGIDINGWHEGNALLTPIWFRLNELKEIGVENFVSTYFYKGNCLELPACNKASKRSGGLKLLYDNYLSTKIKNIKNILEVGCGQGQAGIWFSTAGVTYIGIDVSLLNIGFAIALLPCLKYLKGKDFREPVYKQMIAEDLKFKDKEFDLVFSNQLLDHTHSLNKTIMEQSRVGKSMCGVVDIGDMEEPSEHMFRIKPEMLDDYLRIYCSSHSVDVYEKDIIFWGECK